MLAVTLAFAAAASACGGSVYQPAATAGFEIDPAAEINDEDVRKAFDAKPQMGKPVRIAYYTFDASKAEDLEAMLRSQPGVQSVYRLPPLMMTGEQRWDDTSYRPWNEPKKPFSVKKARLLAARARCDLLVLFDYGHRVNTSANGWVAANVLLLPVLFSPFLDSEVESYLESYVIDTRNGFVYGHVTTDQSGDDGLLTIYSNASDRRIDDQWQALLTATQRKLGSVMRSEWERSEKRNRLREASKSEDPGGEAASPPAAAPPADHPEEPETPEEDSEASSS